jgi:hypothetical protein
MKKILILGLVFVGLLSSSNIQAEVSTVSKVTGVLTSENVFSEYSGDANFSDISADSIEVGDGTAADPSVGIGGDWDTGLYAISNNAIGVTNQGVVRWQITKTRLASVVNFGGGLSYSGSTSTTPFVFGYTDEDTGVGRAAEDALSLIAGAVEGQRITTTGTIFNGSIITPFINVSSATVAVAATYHRIDCLTNDNDVTLNLPTAVGIEGKCYPVRITNASGNRCFLEGAGSETLSPDGVNSFLNYSALNTSGENVEVCSDGANWQVWE